MRYINIYKDKTGNEFSDDTPHKSYDDALMAALDGFGEYVCTYTDKGVICFTDEDKRSIVEEMVAEENHRGMGTTSAMLYQALKPLPNPVGFMPTNPANIDLGEDA